MGLIPLESLWKERSKSGLILILKVIFDPFMAKNVNQIGAFWEPIFGQKWDKIWRRNVNFSHDFWRIFERKVAITGWKITQKLKSMIFLESTEKELSIGTIYIA